jgi:hypothetical protein
MLLLYLLLLGALALFTAYTRNFQRTIVGLGGELGGETGVLLTPREQWWRTAAIIFGWPLAFAVGLAFVAWWTVVALVLAAFLLLVPLLGSFTPRPASPHYVERIRADLARRIAAGGREAEKLQRVFRQLDDLGTPR